MAAVQDFKDIASFLISEFGLPAGAIGLAAGLVRGAIALESDANPRALKYVSDLLTEGNLTNIGKAGAHLVPFVFDKIFGPKHISFRFLWRSIIATTIFWIILLLLRHADWVDVIRDLETFPLFLHLAIADLVLCRLCVIGEGPISYEDGVPTTGGYFVCIIRDY
jgi:hypothetical protein